MELRHIPIMLCFCSLPVSIANANEEGSCDNANYQSCDSQLGWYIGGDIGYAKTDVGSGSLDEFYNASGISANSVDIDDSGLAFSLFAGYQFSTYFGVEAGYLNLGERSVTFTGDTLDKEDFYDNVEHIYPQSSKGFSAALVGSYPLSESFKVSAKLGYFHWKGDYATYEGGNYVGDDTISGDDLWIGGEVNYRIDDNLQVYISAQHFELSRDSTMSFALGLRYFLMAND